MDWLPAETAQLNMYRKMGGMLNNGVQMELDKFFKSQVYIIKTNEAYAEYFENFDTLEVMYNFIRVNEVTKDWTYAECEQFVAWLIEKYSLDTVLKVNFEYNRLEELFGKSLKELHEEWEKKFLESMEKYANDI